MNLYSLASLSLAVACIALALIVFRYSKTKLHIIWAWFNVVVSLWGGGAFLVGISKTYQQALVSWKLAYIGAIFISTLFYHVVHEFCQTKGKKLLIFAYVQSIIFLLLTLTTDILVGPLKYSFNAFYYNVATPLYNVWVAIWGSLVILSFVKLFRFLCKVQGVERSQALYLFIGMLLGFLGGSSTILPSYGIPLYPVWHFSICIYIAIVTFAILRYEFLDIKIVLSRSILPVVICAIILSAYCFVYLDLNLFSAAGFSLSVLCSLLAFIVFVYAQKRVHRIWAIFNVIVATWGTGTFLAGMSSNPESALISWRFTYLPCTFISIVFYHLVCEFSGIKRPRMLAFAYIQGVLLLPFIAFSNYFVGSTIYVFNSIHYHKATFLFTFWLLVWGIITFFAFFELHKFIKRSQGLQRTQALYLFWGMLLGFTGGTTTVIPSYNLPVYPAWHFTICIYAAIMTFAMFRYQIMDIKIAITRLGIFVLVYSIVLGIPFGLEALAKGWLVEKFGQLGDWIPMLTLLAFSTSGPFIFLYVQRRVEAALLQEERRIQDLLNSASKGMRTIRSLPKLSELIVDVLAKSLRLDNAAIYLHEPNHYTLKVSKQEHPINVNIAKSESLIRRLEETQYPVVYEEVKLLSDSEQNRVLHEVAGQMADLRASVVVPAMSDNFLLGFIVLGERKDKRLYSVDLINVLSVLGNQAALAIENCHYIQRMQAEGLAERMISLDHMASSMAHEIDNPMHIIRTSLSFVKSALLRDPRVAMPEEVKQDFDDSLVRSLNASERVSSMIKAVLDYSRMGTGKLESVRISDALEGFLHLIHPQIREERVQFTKEIEGNLPPVLGDRVQMEEVFMNFVRNSLHAVRDCEEKKISLRIFRKNETTIRIECRDNGYGIPKEIINDIFLSSMTTKGSSEGTGLGLYRVRKIVDLFRGKVWAESEGKGKGATFVVELPIYDGNNKNSD